MMVNAVAALALLFSCNLQAQNLRLLSDVDSAQVPSGAGGGSWMPLVSPDGRYVVFASTANNLITTSNGTAIPLRIPPSLNIYLRDRQYGTNTLVSVNTTGVAGGNGDSIPAAISPDGRFVVFESHASDLVAGDANSASDVFVRDLSSGTTFLVSAATNGPSGNGASRSPSMTPDGRYVAFVSVAYNLVPSDTNRIADVFVRDLVGGTTVLASPGALPLTSSLATSEAPDITADGRYVAFYSSATNLVPGTRVGSDIYIRDLSANTTLLASVYARTAVPSNSVTCFNHAFSADGRYLAYQAAGTYARFGKVLRYSLDTGLTDEVGTNAAVSRTPYEDLRSLDISADGSAIAFVANFGTTDGITTCIKLWEGQSGTARIVSGNLSGSGVPAGSICDWPALDPSGRYVAFLSSSTNVVTNLMLGEFHLYLHDSQLSSTTLLDVDTNGFGSGVGPPTAPRLSGDARFVAFECMDANLVANDRNRDSDIFLHDLQAGGIELISGHEPGLPTRTPNGPCTLTPYSVSGDGRYVAFVREADNVIANDTNGVRDIFVRDLATDTTRLVSVSTNGSSANGTSTEATISADGRFVAFTSLADNLVPGDTNRTQDVFICDLQTGTIALVSARTNSVGSANSDSYSPVISGNGRWVMFRSKATNLAPGTYTSGSENLFLRDLQLGTNYALTTVGVKAASMTPDGRFIAVVDTLTSSKYRIWDSLQGAVITTNTALTGISPIAISPDGNRVAYWAGSGTSLQLYAADWRTGTTQAIIHPPHPPLGVTIRFSANSQVVAYNMPDPGGVNQVYAFDFQTGANRPLSTQFGTGQLANEHSDSPAVSADGRFIAYRSEASDIVPNDGNDQPDIFVFDRQTGINTLLSASEAGGGSANNRSLMPVFSGDGTTLLFVSWASDILGNDFNHSSDVFAYTFLTAVLLPGSGAGQGPVVCWPWQQGTSYRVEFKDNLQESAWRELAGSYTNLGVRAFLQDGTPAPAQRFYRIRAF